MHRQPFESLLERGGLNMLALDLIDIMLDECNVKHTTPTMPLASAVLAGLLYAGRADTRSFHKSMSNSLPTLELKIPLEHEDALAILNRLMVKVAEYDELLGE